MRKTILVADDSATIRRVVELAFSESDVRVQSAASGREALERLRSDPPDLVLADVVMPGPSGYEICREVKRSARPVPVLLLAGTFEPFDADRARECGADGHIVKPFESSTLLQRVSELLTRPVSPVRKPGAVERPDAVLDDRSPEGAVRETAFAVAEPSPAGEQVEPTPARTLAPPGLTEADLERLAEAVVRRLSDRVLREIAWEVVPDLAEAIIRERLRELEREEDGRG